MRTNILLRLDASFEILQNLISHNVRSLEVTKQVPCSHDSKLAFRKDTNICVVSKCFESHFRGWLPSKECANTQALETKSSKLKFKSLV